MADCEQTLHELERFLDGELDEAAAARVEEDGLVGGDVGGARVTVALDAAVQRRVHAGGVEVFVGDNAKLTFAQLQDWGRNVFHYGNVRA